LRRGRLIGTAPSSVGIYSSSPPIDVSKISEPALTACAEWHSPPSPWSQARIAYGDEHGAQVFTVTHPFHPLRGQTFDLCSGVWIVTRRCGFKTFPAHGVQRQHSHPTKHPWQDLGRGLLDWNGLYLSLKYKRLWIEKLAFNATSVRSPSSHLLISTKISSPLPNSSI
jgi:hypothetical protein